MKKVESFWHLFNKKITKSIFLQRKHMRRQNNKAGLVSVSLLSLPFTSELKPMYHHIQWLTFFRLDGWPLLPPCLNKSVKPFAPCRDCFKNLCSDLHYLSEHMYDITLQVRSIVIRHNLQSYFVYAQSSRVMKTLCTQKATLQTNIVFLKT